MPAGLYSQAVDAPLHRARMEERHGPCKVLRKTRVYRWVIEVHESRCCGTLEQVEYIEPPVLCRRGRVDQGSVENSNEQGNEGKDTSTDGHADLLCGVSIRQCRLETYRCLSRVDPEEFELGECLEVRDGIGDRGDLVGEFGRNGVSAKA